MRQPANAFVFGNENENGGNMDNDIVLKVVINRKLFHIVW